MDTSSRPNCAGDCQRSASDSNLMIRAQMCRPVANINCVNVRQLKADYYVGQIVDDYE